MSPWGPKPGGKTSERLWGDAGGGGQKRDGSSRIELRILSRLALAALLSLAGAAALAAGSAGEAERADVVWLLDREAGAATAGAFQATFLEDRDGIAVFQVEGSYDRDVGGAFNLSARTAVGQEYYAHHPDDADFLVVYTTFEWNTGGATAFHLGVRNDVEGIGTPVFDNGDLLGSEARLQSYLDMAALERYGFDLVTPAFDQALGVLAHEVLHRWCCRVEVRRPDGSAGDDLLGLEGSHWSYLLDSDASLLYGADWREEASGTFTAAAVSKFYSPLDLYLAGFLEPVEVPPFVLLESPGTDAAQLPLAGASVTATPRTVTVDDVVAAAGPRTPTAADSQKDFRFAFLLLTRADAPATEAHLASLDRLRRAFATRFTALTGGRGLARVLPEGLPDGETGAPPGVGGGPSRPASAASVDDALAWLRSVQGADGHWQDTPATGIRDTALGLRVLTALDPSFARGPEAVAWLEGSEPLSTDSKARRALVLEGLGAGAGDLGELAARQNGDGGWGADAGLASDALDTVLALEAFLEDAAAPAGVVAPAVSFLEAAQGGDGSWSPGSGGVGDPGLTARVVEALGRTGSSSAAVEGGLAWLAGQQSGSDGGFGAAGSSEGTSSVFATALVLRALGSLQALDGVDAGAAELFLLSRQSTEGSWNGSVATTALVASALQRLSLPNLVPASLSARPEEPREGERTELEVTVVNEGSSPSAATLLRFFAGDPAGGGFPLGLEAPVPALAGGQSVLVSATWEAGPAGEVELAVMVDPDGTVPESSEADNVLTGSVTVQPAPEGVELELREGDLTATPATPDSLPAEIALTAVVRNFGQTDAVDVAVSLWRGEVAAGELVETVVLPLLASGSSLPANFVDLLTEPGLQLYMVEASVDPPDGDPSNNRATAVVETVPATDLEILAEDLSLSRNPAVVGTDVLVTATVRNRGTVVAPTSVVRYSVSDGTTTEVIRELTASIGPGGTVEQSFPWRVDRAGDLTLIAEADPLNLVPEVDESNNEGMFPFQATALTEPNLTLAAADLAFGPDPALEGAAVELSILLRNTGGTDLASTTVAFYDGDPASGGGLLGEVTTGPVASGEDVPVTFSWPAVPDAAERLIFAVADPGDDLAEADEGDNRAFRRLTVLGLPDLALSSAGLSLSPALPLPGQVVELAVTVANLGEQGSGPVALRLLEGGAGGPALAPDQEVEVPGLGQVEATFTFTLGAGASTLAVVADPDGAVPEAEEGNNAATVELTAQDPDFYVSRRYFSPNGDGVSDDTRLTYRLDAPAVVEVLVVDGEGTVVRREPGDGAARSAGSFLWDGRDDRGVVVAEGVYALRVLRQDGQLLGAAEAVVDVNRAPLSLALGTPYERFTNLSCQLDDAEAWALTAEESAVLLAVRSSTAELERGLYRVDLSRPVPESLVADAAVRSVAAASQGSRIAWRQSSAPSGVWVQDGPGGAARQLSAGGLLAGITAAGDEVIVSQGSPTTIRALAADGSGGSRDLLPLGGSLAGAAQSRDQRYLAVVEEGGTLPSDSFAVWLLDLEAGTALEVAGPVFLQALPSFSPDGRRLALADAGGGSIVVIRTADGSVEQDLALPQEPFPRELLSAADAALVPDPWQPPLAEIPHLAWSPASDGLLALAFFGDPGCEGFWRLFDADAVLGGVTAVAWAAPRAVEDPEGECSDSDRQSGPLVAGVVAEAGAGAGFRSSSNARSAADGGASRVSSSSSGARLAAAADLGSLEAFTEPVGLEAALAASTVQLLVPAAGPVAVLEAGREALVGPWGVDLREPGSRRLFTGFEGFAPESLLPGGRGLLFRSADLALDPASPCFERGDEDLWSFVSLLNLTAELFPRISAEGTAVVLEGTAADLNFARYLLEWRPAEGPDSWLPVAPPVATPVLGDQLGLWVPPAPGSYLVRLTVEDKAGNRRSAVRSVATAGTPAIASLVVAPEVFSADPGARQSHTEIRYEVLAPVNLAISVYRLSEEGGPETRVRTFLRSHAAPAPEQVVLWDGRDDHGVPVTDGDYEVRVQGFRLPVAVDSTPPEVAVEVEGFSLGGRAFLCDAGLRAVSADLGYVLVSSFNGAAPEDRILEWGEGLAPSIWRPLSVPGSSVELSLPEATGRRYRGRAEDAVGNATLALAPLPEEVLTLVSLGPESLDDGGLPVDRQVPVYYPDPEETPADLPPRFGEPVTLLVPAGPLRLGLKESLRSPLGQLSLLYETAEEPGLWQELPVPAVYPPGSAVPVAPAPQHELEALAPAGLPVGQALRLRLKATSPGGAVILSNEAAVFLWQVTYRGRLRPQDLDDGAPFADELAALLAQADLDPAATAVLWGTKQLEDPAAGVYLRLWVGDDGSGIDPWRRVETAAESAGVFIAAVPEDLDGDADVPVRVGRGLPTGCTVHDPADFEVPVCSSQDPDDCDGGGSGDPVQVSLAATRGFADEATCGTSERSRLRIGLRPLLSGEGVGGESLQIFEGEELVFSVAQPVNGRLYAWERDESFPLAQDLVFRAVLTATGGRRAERIVRYPADGEPPVLEVTSPVSDGRVCAVRGTHSCAVPGAGPFFFPVAGTVSDDTGVQYQLSLLGQVDGSPVESPFLDLPANQLCTQALGQLGVLGDAPGEVLLAGDVTLRALAEDAGGNVVCREIPFHLDGSLDPVAFGVESVLVSPNGDAFLDEAVFTYSTEEPARLTLRLYPAVAPGVAGTVPVRTLAEAVEVTAAGSLGWDGRDDGGALLPDGRYLAVATFEDLCGFEGRLRQWVELDRTAPVAAITAPAPGDPLGLVVEVQGTADDRNFERYEVAWGAGAAPAAFVRIGGGTGAVAAGPLASWDTTGLSGEGLLRLRAWDLAGNGSEVTVPLTLPPRVGVIGGAEVLPGLFSPDSDGTLDEVALRYTLLQGAQVDLVVANEAGQAVRTLVAGEDRPAGSRVVGWDGRNDGGVVVADGLYRVTLTAAAATGEEEEAVLAVTVDATSPTLSFSQPAAGSFIQGAGEVVGTVDEAHPERWTLAVSPAGAGSWTTLAEGRETQADAVIGSLGGLSEGAYDLRLEATDRAGNGAALVQGFVVDDTAPVAGITAPPGLAFVSGLEGPVTIEGTATDEHFASYRLEAGVGADPATFSLLAEGSAPVAAGALASWSAGAWADGPTTLRLTVTDRASNVSETLSTVNLDNTLPTAAIGEPAEGGYVTGPMTVIGMAADANLDLYRLEVAPAGTGLFSPIATGEAPVVDGPLASWQALPPDGEATLRLTVEDRAGNQRQATVSVTVDTQAPPAPQGLEAVLASGPAVALSWSPVAASDLAGYRLYRDGQPITADLVSGTNNEDGAPGSGLLTYTVTALDLAGNESPPSAPARISVDTDPPNAALSRPRDGDRVSGLVDVTGSAFSPDDFREYRLSVIPAGGPAILLRSSPAPVEGGLLGQWSTLGLAEESLFSLRLEAEDLSGNVAVREVAVTVDNLGPAAPTGLAAAAEGTDGARLTWNANGEGDLAGYLLYRDGRLVNAPGPVGDVLAFLLPPSGGGAEAYLDLALPDGTFAYRVVAVDEAGNQSPPSAAVELTVETGAPRAVLVAPEDGTEFDEPLHLAAVAEDRDVVHVNFQLKPAAQTSWEDLSQDSESPFEALWDPASQGRPYGDYDLRAVAADGGDRVDPAPVAIRVVFTDRTAPPPVEGLVVEAVDGGIVDLAWDAVEGVSDFAGYRLFRAAETGEAAELPGLLTATTFQDGSPAAPLADDLWVYHLVAEDTAGNRSTPSAPAEALVYTPELFQPETPTPDASVDLQGTAPVAGGTAAGELRHGPAVLALDSVAVAPDGGFIFSDVALERGESVLAVRVTDAAGRRSKEAVVSVVSAPPPSAPLWQSAVVTGQLVDLEWQPVPEPDVQGYRLFRDGEAVLTGGTITGTTYSEELPDGTYVYTVEAVNDQGFAGPLSQPRQVTVGDGVAPETVVLSAAAVGSEVELSWTESPDGDVALYEVSRDGAAIHEHGDLASLAFTDGPLANGTYVYQVVAVDVGANRSEPSNAVAVTISAQLPAAPVLTAVEEGVNALTVSWQPGTGDGSEPPAEAYRLYRSTDIAGPFVPVAVTAGLSFEDAGLTAGQAYVYVVRALDGLSNESADSNTGSGTPQAVDPGSEPPDAPRWQRPTVPGTPFLTAAPTVTVGGATELGTRVEVFKNGAVVGEVEVAAGGLQALPGLVVHGSLEPSPDSSLLAVIDSGLYASSVYELGTDTETAVPALQPPMRWFADGRRIAFPSGTSASVLDLEDGTVLSLGLADAATVAAPSPTGEEIAVLAARFGGEGLWTFTEGSFIWTLKLAAPLSSFDAESLRWSPDGSALLVKQGFLFKSWRLVDAASGATSTPLTLAGRSGASFAPDGSNVAFTEDSVDGETVVVVNPWSGEVIFRAAAQTMEPRFSPAGDALAYLNGDGAVALWDPGTGETRPGPAVFPSAPDPALAAQWQWTTAGMIFNRGTDVVVLSPEARFELADVVLDPGDNLFTAVALDAGGRQSPESETMVVVRDVAGLPDLEVEASGILIQPVLPQVGDPARLTVVVTNEGSGPSAATSLAVEILDPAGAPLTAVGSLAVPELAAGASTAIPLDFSALEAGAYTVAAVVDPADEVLEVSEVNNRAFGGFTVVGEGGPQLTLATDRDLYAAGDEVQATVTVTNGGEVFTGEVEVSLEDSAGRSVQLLATVPVAELAFGASFEAEASWPSGGALAGDYAVRARLADSGGAPVAEATAAFTLAENLEVAATVAANRALYLVGEEAVLTGRISYPAGNAVLEGLQARLILTTAGGEEVSRWEADLGTLLPGGELRQRETWAAAEAGTFELSWQVLHLGRPLANAEGGFEVVAPGPGPPELQAFKEAELAVDADGDGEASPGDELEYLVTVTSLGQQTAADVVVEDSVAAPPQMVAGSVVTDRGTVVSEDPLRVEVGDLALGERAEIRFRVLLAEPWPESLVQVSNQALVSAEGIPGLPTDDPGTLQPADPTVVPVRLGPALEVLKTDLLAVDGTGDGLAGPGDVVEYEITVTNRGSAEATGIEVTDFVPSQTAFVPGSIVASGATVVGEDPIVAERDALPPGESLSISFRVELASPLPVEVREIVNQAAVTSSELPVIVSDDPETAAPEDATRTPVFPEPELTLTGAEAVEGDLLVTLPVTLSEPPAASVAVHYRAVSGSALEGEDFAVTSGVLTLVAGETAGEIIVPLLDDDVPEGEESFLLVLDEVVGALAQASEVTVTVLDDDLVAGLAATQTVALAVDLDGDGQAEPGETLEYRTEISNTGEALLSSVVFESAVPIWTELVGGSIQTSAGTVLPPSGGGPQVRVEVPELAAAGVVVVTHQVTVADPIPTPELEILSQGTVTSDQLQDVLTDDPGRPGAADATVITVLGEIGLGASLVAEVVEPAPSLLPGESRVTAAPGDVVRLSFEIVNAGTAAGNEGWLFMSWPEGVAPVESSVVVSQGQVDGTDPLAVSLEALWPGPPVMVELEARLSDPLPPGVEQIVLQGFLSGADFAELPTDDPELPGATDPTIVEIDAGAGAVDIPAQSLPGLVLLVLLLLASGLLKLRRHGDLPGGE